MKLKPFLDAHYGPLSDNRRYWFGALLLLRAAILLISALVPSTNYNITMLIVTCFCALLIFATTLNMYQDTLTTSSEILFFINLVLLAQTRLFADKSAQKQTVAANILVGMAFFHFVVLVLLAAYKRIREMNICVHIQAFVQMDANEEDEMEILHLADIERDTDRDSVSSESDSQEYDESRRTY